MSRLCLCVSSDLQIYRCWYMRRSHSAAPLRFCRMENRDIKMQNSTLKQKEQARSFMNGARQRGIFSPVSGRPDGKRRRKTEAGKETHTMHAADEAPCGGLSQSQIDDA